MIADQDLPELAIYRQFEKRIPFATEDSLEHLVTGTNNEQNPVHRWLRYKESFSADLLKVVIEKYTPHLGRQIRLLDPFAGVGTSLLSAQEMHATGMRIDAIGIERNPFAAFAANTKLSWPNLAKGELLDAGETAIRTAIKRIGTVPALSSLSEGRC